MSSNNDSDNVANHPKKWQLEGAMSLKKKLLPDGFSLHEMDTSGF
jgi:hypothetical protein